MSTPLPDLSKPIGKIILVVFGLEMSWHEMLSGERPSSASTVSMILAISALEKLRRWRKRRTGD